MLGYVCVANSPNLSDLKIITIFYFIIYIMMIWLFKNYSVLITRVFLIFFLYFTHNK